MTGATGNVRIVLVRPSDARNIGAVARAMRVTGFSRLVLVNPSLFDASLAARVSCRSESIIESAARVGSVAEAVADCDYVIAATRRVRELDRGEPLTPRALAEELSGAPGAGNVAILFGAEKVGLSNLEMEPAHRILTIPTAAADMSLNLAQSVMVVCYELSQIAPAAPRVDPDEEPLPTVAELEEMYAHLAEAVASLDFPPERADKWRDRLRGLLQRARLRRGETYLFRTLADRILRRRSAPRDPEA